MIFNIMYIIKWEKKKVLIELLVIITRSNDIYVSLIYWIEKISFNTIQKKTLLYTIDLQHYYIKKVINLLIQFPVR